MESTSYRFSSSETNKLQTRHFFTGVFASPCLREKKTSCESLIPVPGEPDQRTEPFQPGRTPTSALSLAPFNSMLLGTGRAQGSGGIMLDGPGSRPTLYEMGGGRSSDDSEVNVPLDCRRGRRPWQAGGDGSLLSCRDEVLLVQAARPPASNEALARRFLPPQAQ